MKKGFTLIELLVVISIIAILATVVFVALNPAKRFTDARNSRRWNDVNNYLTALHACLVDNGGIDDDCLPVMTTDTLYEIVSSGTTGCNAQCAALTGSCANLATTTDFLKYLKELPKDPAGAAAAGHTGYSIRETNGMYTIANCTSEGAAVQVSR